MERETRRVGAVTDRIDPQGSGRGGSRGEERSRARCRPGSSQAVRSSAAVQLPKDWSKLEPSMSSRSNRTYMKTTRQTQHPIQRRWERQNRCMPGSPPPGRAAVAGDARPGFALFDCEALLLLTDLGRIRSTAARLPRSDGPTGRSMSRGRPPEGRIPPRPAACAGQATPHPKWRARQGREVLRASRTRCRVSPARGRAGGGRGGGEVYVY